VLCKRCAYCSSLSSSCLGPSPLPIKPIPKAAKPVLLVNPFKALLNIPGVLADGELNGVGPVASVPNKKSLLLILVCCLN
jgi:hypothetical protein